jgi:enoyl-[acyl-carrier-protein] reductase (NADH)
MLNISALLCVLNFKAVFSMQVLAYEAGRKGKIRVNTISAGILFTKN